MIGKSSAVPLLLWLLVAPFFNQIDGNNTVSPSKVRLILYFIACFIFGPCKLCQYIFVSRILRLGRKKITIVKIISLFQNAQPYLNVPKILFLVARQVHHQAAKTYFSQASFRGQILPSTEYR